MAVGGICLESELFDAQLLEELVENTDEVAQSEAIVSDNTYHKIYVRKWSTCTQLINISFPLLK